MGLQDRSCLFCHAVRSYFKMRVSLVFAQMPYAFCATSRACFLYFSQDRFLLSFQRLLGRVWNMNWFGLCANSVCVLCKGNLAWGSTVRSPLYCMRNHNGDLCSSQSPRLEASCCYRALFYTTDDTRRVGHLVFKP